ncbi:MAG: hypothetical protein QM778_31040 [Myxococcales bacterium]
MVTQSSRLPRNSASSGGPLPYVVCVGLSLGGCHGDGGSGGREGDGGLGDAGPGDAEVQANVGDGADAGDAGKSPACTWTRFGDGLAPGHVAGAWLDPRDDDRVYAVAGETLYASTDFGNTWVASEPLSAGIVDLAFPSDAPDSLLAATNDGVLFSDDSGATWSPKALGGLAITTLLAMPAEPRRLLAGSIGYGILGSVDEGHSWGNLNQGVPYSHITALQGHPSDPLRAVAGLIELNDSGGWSMLGAVLSTVDGGHTWNTILDGRGRVMDVSICPAMPEVIFVATATGVSRSVDDGANWDHIPLAAAIQSIEVSGADCKRVILDVQGQNQGIRRSDDGGESWTDVLKSGLLETVGPVTHSLRMNQHNPDLVLMSDRSGAYLSTDAGEAWSLIDGIGSLSITQLSLMGPSLWLSSWGSGPWVWSADTARWQRVSLDALPDDYAFGMAASGETVLVGGWPSIWLSQNSGQTFTAVDKGNALAFAFQPGNTNTVLAATQTRGVLKSVNGGLTWQESNAGLPEAWATSAGTFRDIRSIWFDPNNAQHLIIGTNGRGLFQSSDAGDSWVAVGGDLANASVPQIVQADQDLYAVISQRGVARSQDGGTSWVFVNDGLPSLSANSLLWDNPGQVLYAGTKAGVFTLGEDGWEPRGVDCIPGNNAGSLALIQVGGRPALVTASGMSGPYMMYLDVFVQ